MRVCVRVFVYSFSWSCVRVYERACVCAGERACECEHESVRAFVHICAFSCVGMCVCA